MMKIIERLYANCEMSCYIQNDSFVLYCNFAICNEQYKNSIKNIKTKFINESISHIRRRQ